MKKLIALILCCCMMLALAACGGQTVKEVEDETTAAAEATKGAAATEAPEASQPTAEDIFSFTYNNVEIPMNAPAADIIAALGEPKNYTEEPSCAFEGLDKTYFFGSFYLQTYPSGDEDFVYSLWLVDDSVETGEGLFIGMKQADAEKIMGAESFNGSNAYTLEKGASSLTVIVEDGAVSSIQFRALVGE